MKGYIRVIVEYTTIYGRDSMSVTLNPRRWSELKLLISHKRSSLCICERVCVCVCMRVCVCIKSLYPVNARVRSNVSIRKLSRGCQFTLGY